LYSAEAARRECELARSEATPSPIEVSSLPGSRHHGCAALRRIDDQENQRRGIKDKLASGKLNTDRATPTADRRKKERKEEEKKWEKENRKPRHKLARAVRSYAASDNERRKSCAVGGQRAPGGAIVGSAESRSIRSLAPGVALARSLLSRAGSSREKFSRRRVVARVRGQDRAFRGVRGVGGGSPESVPRVGSRWDESSTVSGREGAGGPGDRLRGAAGARGAKRSER